MCVLAFLLVGQSYSQEEVQLTAKDSIVKSAWMFGVGFNAVDDSGDAFNDFTTIKDQWNAVPFPSRLSIGRYFESGLGLEAIATYNNYKEGNIIDGRVNPEDKSYYGFDTRLSYDLNKLIGETGWFDPYVGAGLGYTDANDIGRGTYNAVVGFRTWFSDRWGLDFNSSGKWSFGNEATNHIQHGAGVVYRFGIEKGLSKKGEEKLALIEAMEKEKQRVQDSIAAANREKEAAALAERLAREREQAELAAAEKARLEAAQQRKAELQQSINDLGYVYFNFDSSSLTSKSKEVLDALSVLLQNAPEAEIQVSSHTDSRGPSAYNKWLSEQRVKRTTDYLLNKGIAPTRMQSEGFGETNLLNECDDNTYCSESKHKLNRRSEFLVIKL